jgi:UDP-N-acetyl-D-glucosamine dehydrogenase
MDRIKDRSANVVVVGAGYVGLPLAVEIAKAGFSVIAYDRSGEKVSSINAGRSYIEDVPTSVVGPLVADKKLGASTDPDVLGKADAVII